MAVEFEFPAGGSYGRPLALGSEGWGVSALQSALGLTRSAKFDDRTDEAVRAFQKDHAKAVGPADGIAGPRTKHGLMVINLRPHLAEADIIKGLPLGIVDGESNGQLDAQSPTYMRADGKRADLGVCQFSTVLADRDAVERNIDVRRALHFLCLDADRGMRPRHDRYIEAKWVKSLRSKQNEWAWWLACASWNAPSWADRWAERGPDAMSSSQLDHLTRYVRTKAVYCPSLLDLR